MELQAQRIYFNGTQYGVQLVSTKSISIKGLSKVIFDLQSFSLGIASGSDIKISLGDKPIGSVSNNNLSGLSSYEVPINQAIANSGIIKIRFQSGSSPSGIQFKISGSITRIRLA